MCNFSASIQIILSLTAPEVGDGSEEKAMRFYRILITYTLKGNLIFPHALQIICVLGPCGPLQLL